MFHWNVLVKKKEKKRGANDVLYDYNLYDVGGKLPDSILGEAASQSLRNK